MKRVQKVLMLLVVVTLILSSVNLSAFAKELPITGSLVINKKETGKTDDDGNPLGLKGVKFIIYKVAEYYEDYESTEVPDMYKGDNYNVNTEEIDDDGKVIYCTYEAVTNDEGQVKFENLPLGRYLVEEAEVPANVTAKIANFLVDIPQTTDNGTELNYNVEVTPKNNTVYGGITLTTVDSKNNQPLEGTQFILQKQDGDNWEEYKKEVVEDGEKNYVSLGILTAKADGTISVEGLPQGRYRFIEVKTSNDGYILDNETTYRFTVSLNEDKSTDVTPSEITVRNEKPEVEKNITTAGNENNSFNIGDTIDYKVTIDVPSMIDRMNSYTVSDKMEKGLTFAENSFVAKAINGRANSEDVTPADAVLSNETDYTLNTNTDGKTWVLTFTEDGISKIKSYGKIEFSYSAVLNREIISENNIKALNKASLEYSNKVEVDYNGNNNGDETAIETKVAEANETIYTGGFYIEKHALRADGQLLAGAVFKLAKTEADAIEGNYLTDENGNVIELTTNESGIASYCGLKYGTYYLIEVQAPVLEEVTNSDGTTTKKYYNLLKDPVAIMVNADTFKLESANIVINKTGTILPMTGGIGSIVITTAGILLIAIGIAYYIKNRKEEN